MILKQIPILFSFLFSVHVNAAANQCHDLFSSAGNNITTIAITEKIDALAKLYLQIELKSISPDSIQQAVDDLNTQLAKLNQVDSEAKNKFKKRISELYDQMKTDKNKKEKEEEILKEERRKIVEAVDPKRYKERAIFHEIRPGKFKMGQARVETEITKPFAMMATPVTQALWTEVQRFMGATNPKILNPSYYKGDTYPITGISWEQSVQFVEYLNKMSNSDNSFTQINLKSMISGHQKGDIYDIPTHAQREFVMRNRGKANKDFFDQDNENEIGKYAWYYDNSGGKTHEVASLNPRIIDGQAFFDLEGNVREIMKDGYNPNPTGGKDPINAIEDQSYSESGGSYWGQVTDLQSSHYTKIMKQEVSYNTGLRLIRIRNAP